MMDLATSAKCYRCQMERTCAQRVYFYHFIDLTVRIELYGDVIEER